jgi:hypothetical protein
MLLLEPHSGLANRMRVIASGLMLAERMQQKLYVIWNANEELNSPFYNLFEPIRGLEFTSPRFLFKYALSANSEIKVKRYFARLVNWLLGIDYCIKDEDFKKVIWNGKLDLFKICSVNTLVYFRTCEEFGDNNHAFKKFRPVPSLQQIIDREKAKFNSSTIGLHIRRGDNSISTEKSPIHLFIGRIQQEIELNEQANFFLATDDAKTEYELKSLFGDKIFTYSKIRNRNTPEGIADAVVDMYCLAGTIKLYGSYWSSYSEIAAKIGQIELIQLKEFFSKLNEQ